MTVTAKDKNGLTIVYNEENKRWEYEDGTVYESDKFMIVSKFMSQIDEKLVMDTDEEVDVYYTVGAVVDKLNKLSEKNRQLKEENYVLQDGLDFYKEQNGSLSEEISNLLNENDDLKQLIKKVLETTPMKHKLAMELKNSVRELYD